MNLVFLVFFKKRKNPNKDGYNYKFEWTDSKPKFYEDILILADGRANKILWDEFRNGKRVYDKNLKKSITNLPKINIDISYYFNI